MKNYNNVVANVPTKVVIDSIAISNIIKEEIGELLGGKNRYVMDGIVYENKPFYGSNNFIREATEDESEIYKSLKVAYDYFYNL